MGALITFIITRTGLGSLAASIAAYAVIALIAGGGFWAWSAHKYHAGYSTGEIHERTAWQVEQRRKEALAEADRQQKQDALDRLATIAENARNRADDAEAKLAEASAKSKTKDDIGLPRDVGRQLNKVGQW